MPATQAHDIPLSRPSLSHSPHPSLQRNVSCCSCAATTLAPSQGKPCNAQARALLALGQQQHPRQHPRLRNTTRKPARLHAQQHSCPHSSASAPPTRSLHKKGASAGDCRTPADVATLPSLRCQSLGPPPAHSCISCSISSCCCRLAALTQVSRELLLAACCAARPIPPNGPPGCCISNSCCCSAPPASWPACA